MATQGRIDPILISGPKGIDIMINTVLNLQGGFRGFKIEFAIIDQLNKSNKLDYI